MVGERYWRGLGGAGFVSDFQRGRRQGEGHRTHEVAWEHASVLLPLQLHEIVALVNDLEESVVPYL